MIAHDLQYRASREHLLEKSLALLEKDRLAGLAFLAKPPGLGFLEQVDTYPRTPSTSKIPAIQSSITNNDYFSEREIVKAKPGVSPNIALDYGTLPDHLSQKSMDADLGVQDFREKAIQADIKAMDDKFLKADVDRIKLTSSTAYQRPKSTLERKKNVKSCEPFQKTALSFG